MRTNAKIRSVQATADTPLVTSAETVVATLNGVSTQSPDAIVRFFGTVVVLVGTGTTALVIRIRRGSGITGTVVGEANQVAATVGSQVPFSYNAEDSPGEVGGVPYVLTVTQTGASANGQAIYASLLAMS